jgi:hypothetical protein
MRALLASALLAGCASGPDAPLDPAAPAGGFAELWEQGADRYLGAFPPDTQDEQAGVTTYAWTGADGPTCLRGTPYQAAWRPGNGEDLHLFLQGGGACWSEFCFAIEESAPGVPDLDVLDPAVSPVAGWDTTYLPYCDASLFAGDIDVDDDGDGEVDRHHRGLANLSAALDVAHANAPAPRRVLLAGSSGGGYGTIIATMLARRLWPDAELVVMNDAGVGIADPGNPDFAEGLVAEWGAEALVPASCEDCFGDGHMTGLVDWELAHDPDLRVGVFSTTRDRVIGGIFLGLPDEAFEAAVRAETAELHARYPDRYQPFVMAGEEHTVLLGALEGFLDVPEGAEEQIAGYITLSGMEEAAVGDVRFLDWFGWMIEGDARWTATVAE